MISFRNDTFTWTGHFAERHRAKDAGFRWHPGVKTWYTKSPFYALNLAAEADISAKEALRPYLQNTLHSGLLDDVNGLFSPATDPGYMPFQRAGIWTATRRLEKQESVAVFDSPGLGKTIQAIGVLNELGFRKVLVICPAFLRNNWYKEMKKWWANFDEPSVLFSRKDRINGKSVICSYDLSEMLKPGWDCVIIDECHRLKNPTAKRTRKILTNKDALVKGAKTVALSGTPLPNGKPEEVWTILSSLAPEVVSDFRDKWSFIYRYCEVEEDAHGKYITGVKNHEELGQRLRASGFMIRRLKSEVLTQLPDKRHNMIVVNPNSKARKLLEKESAFDLDEIEKHGGKTFASGLPELRRELGLTKIETSVEIIRELMEAGADKILVGAHHVDVVKGIAEGLSKYCRTEFITGATSNDNRARYVRDFQETEGQMALVGQIDAIGEGLTLTAASDCVQVEESWGPGKNDQFSDRCHRIGQKNAVTVHHIVYENSLDAKILFRHTEKSLDSEKIVG